MMQLALNSRLSIAGGLAITFLSLSGVCAQTIEPSIRMIASKGKLVYTKQGLAIGSDSAEARFFEDRQVADDVRGIAGQLFFQDGPTVDLSYYENEGGQPTIADIFTCATQGTESARIVVICTWNQLHSGLDTRGVYYKPYVYRQAEGSQGKWTRLALDTVLMNALGEGFDGVQEGENVRFEYKDRKSILGRLSVYHPDILQTHQSSLSVFRSGEKLQAAQTLLTAVGPKPWTIDNSNVTIFNDLGYFLEESGQFKDAVDVLTSVLAAFPDRTVAYLNLADAYAGLKDTPRAKTNYRKYVDLMTKAGKQAKIPRKVADALR